MAPGLPSFTMWSNTLVVFCRHQQIHSQPQSFGEILNVSTLGIHPFDHRVLWVSVELCAVNCQLHLQIALLLYNFITITAPSVIRRQPFSVCSQQQHFGIATTRSHVSPCIGKSIRCLSRIPGMMWFWILDYFSYSLQVNVLGKTRTRSSYHLPFMMPQFKRVHVWVEHPTAQRNMKMASVFLKALTYYSSWPETISLSFLLDEDINAAFINLRTSESANIHFVEIICVPMPRQWSQRKARDTALPCIRWFWTPFFTLWLLLQVLINSGAHAARMHFPGGEENIQGEKKNRKKER